MGSDRTLVSVAVFVVCSAVLAVADSSSGQPIPEGAVTQSATEVPCTPVDTTWPMSSSGPYELRPPSLAVVATDLRPKDTVVLLDGRVTGRSRFFNGKKGFLYLEPGRYTLAFELDGYRPETFAITAKPGCRFDIRHRMEKARGAVHVSYPQPLGKGEPTRWIWDPIDAPPAAARSSRPHGPDPSLRPDLGAVSPQVPGTGAAVGSLRLRIKPDTASVYLDGSFLATARELDLMVAAVVIPAGRHVLEVRATGYPSRTEELNVAAGELVELEVVLAAAAP